MHEGYGSHSVLMAQNLLTCTFANNTHILAHFLLQQHPSIIILSYYDVSVGYILRCRSLRYLHNRGPKAQSCVNRIKTEPRYITDLYDGLRGPENASSW